ncbi:nuclear transport factor 2 family protein [Muriicola sp. Z0-33]|uniref:nuclear transport factor 2 family protein n=1 Tax=Muriicola sp. Z0-33 TaxID=2816957 RepID=UPI0022388517|nr:nuclear transport factor 2 family protein [Muriicola sp. Z0-33]MCW5516939.1 nuclear transport factor 2 family protein [Muriicola sp. Z0-33]
MIQDISKKVIATWVTGFHKEDANQLTNLFSEDATFVDPRFPQLKGKGTINDYYHHLLSETTNWGATIFEGPYLYGKDCFAIRSLLKFTWRENNVTIDWPFVAFFKVRLTDGKVIRYDEYWDTEDTLRRLGIKTWGPLPAYVKTK